jgi:hypothetical protein
MKWMPALYTPLFPYDPAIDSVLEHRHLVLAYGVVVVAQIIYAAYLIWRYLGVARVPLRSRRGISHY